MYGFEFVHDMNKIIIFPLGFEIELKIFALTCGQNVFPIYAYEDNFTCGLVWYFVHICLTWILWLDDLVLAINSLIHVHDLMQYGVKIFVMTSFKETCYIEILPNVEKSRKGNVVYLNSYRVQRVEEWLIWFRNFKIQFVFAILQIFF